MGRDVPYSSHGIEGQGHRSMSRVNTITRRPKEPCIRRGTYGRHLDSTVERPELGGDDGRRYC